MGVEAFRSHAGSRRHRSGGSPVESQSERRLGSDLNPIELASSKLKKLLRDGTERTVDGLWNLCGRIVDQFSNEECRNYFKHCGYRYD